MNNIKIMLNGRYVVFDGNVPVRLATDLEIKMSQFEYKVTKMSNEELLSSWLKLLERAGLCSDNEIKESLYKDAITAHVEILKRMNN